RAGLVPGPSSLNVIRFPNIVAPPSWPRHAARVGSDGARGMPWPVPRRAKRSTRDARKFLRAPYEPRDALRGPRSPRSANAGAPEPEAERALVESEDARGLALVAVGHREGPEKHLPLDVAERGAFGDGMHTRDARLARLALGVERQVA